EQLVLHHAVFDAGGASAAHEVERVGQGYRGRLLAIDVLPRGDCEIEVVLALAGGDGVEIDGLLARVERAVEIGGRARDAVGLGERRQLLGVAPDQDRIRHDAVAARKLEPTLGADRQHRAGEMLDRPHAPGDAVHDDAQTPLAHRVCPSVGLLWAGYAGCYHSTRAAALPQSGHRRRAENRTSQRASAGMHGKSPRRTHIVEWQTETSS